MDVAPLVLGFLLITLFGALASLVGTDSRDGFDGRPTPGSHPGPNYAR